MEKVPNKGTLLKYKRKSDKAIFSVKPIMIPNGSSPQAAQHPLVLHNEYMLKFPHNNLAKYYGYAERQESDYTEVLLFFEESEGILTDYLQDNKLNKEDVNSMVNGLIDVFMYIDRHAFALPSHISLNNILVIKTGFRSRCFKLFGTLPYDEDKNVNESDLKWVAPEVYEKYKLKRSHLYINAEKAVFYSLGIVIIYAVLKDLITEGRDQIQGDKFTGMNEVRENRAITDAKAKFASKVSDKALLNIIEKLLVYSDKGRNDFRVWRLKNENSLLGVKAADQTHDFRSTNESKDSIAGGAQELVIEGDEKNGACCNSNCNIF